MTLEYRKRCLEYALEQCRRDAIVNMTDDEIIAEWGFQRSPAGPLHAAASRIEKTEAENKQQRELLREALEVLIKTPLIEAITPTSEEWRTCETVQDAYDLMKHRIRAAADKIRAALEQQKGEEL